MSYEWRLSDYRLVATKNCPTYDLFTRLQFDGLGKCSKSILSIAVIHSRIRALHITNGQLHEVYWIVRLSKETDTWSISYTRTIWGLEFIWHVLQGDTGGFRSSGGYDKCGYTSLTRLFDWMSTWYFVELAIWSTALASRVKPNFGVG